MTHVYRNLFPIIYSDPMGKPQPPMAHPRLAEIVERVQTEARQAAETQEKFAEKANLTQSAVCTIKSGKRWDPPYTRVPLNSILWIWEATGRKLENLIPKEDQTDGWPELIEKLLQTTDGDVIRKFLEIYVYKEVIHRRLYFTILKQHIEALHEEIKDLKKEDNKKII